jgi:hypothetical protein
MTWGYSSVLEHLPGMHKILDLNPNTKDMCKQYTKTDGQVDESCRCLLYSQEKNYNKKGKYFKYVCMLLL